jgi:carbamoyl-phosphate synthase small subunit
MTGYHEILTDPSYCGQVVLMTYPLIGNYGVAEEDAESPRAWPEAFVAREIAPRPSSHRASCSLPAWLEKNGVVGIEGVDTRLLTRRVREAGCLRCVVSSTDSDTDSLVQKARAAPATDGRDLARQVTCAEPYTWVEGYQSSYPTPLAGTDGKRLRCVAYDFGIKRNILRSLVHCGFDVTVVPADTPAATALALEPEAVFLSNGPGDPAAVTGATDAVADLLPRIPIFGICLGHQILTLALGARTEKMPFGHHGANHPVRDLLTGHVEITSQNHSFAVVEDSLPDAVELTHINLNDNTVEGIQHKSLPVFSVQYHPEAAPGPLDSTHLFARFRACVADAR